VIEIFILSLIQGITEFLPISSSSHLYLLSNYINFENQSLSIDVSLHIGSFIAVIIYFKKELINFARNKQLLLKILISSVPTMILGLVLVQTNFIEKIRNIEVIAWTTIIFGILLYISDNFKLNKEIKKDFDYKSVFFIGFFQMISLIPGVSRSGITITVARFLQFKRLDAAKISFLISIPTLAAVSFFGFYNLAMHQEISFSLINFLSILLSFFFSYLTIKYFLKYIQKFSLKIFVVYRIILGIILLTIIYL
tara:strand:- start:6715 stop:7473 length:759 start_codon:yes stop_codon:yes gene_type:complete